MLCNTALEMPYAMRLASVDEPSLFLLSKPIERQLSTEPTCRKTFAPEKPSLFSEARNHLYSSTTFALDKSSIFVQQNNYLKSSTTSVFNKSSRCLQQQQQLQQPQQPHQQRRRHLDSFSITETRPLKRVKIETNSTASHTHMTAALHLACRAATSNLDFVKSIIDKNPTLATCRIKLSTTKKTYDAALRRLVSRPGKELYSLPLNLALQNRASMSIIETLISAAPTLLTLKDGPQGLTPLHVLLKHHTDYEDPMIFMLLRNPEIASITDDRGNTPLHYACMYGASLDVIKHLCVLFPRSLHLRNRDNVTPVQLAQRSASTRSEETATYLWSMQDEETSCPLVSGVPTRRKLL